MSAASSPSTLGATRTRSALPPLTTLEDIQAARAALPDCVRLTPVLPVSRDSAEIDRERLFVKAESLQITGAYKIRAAFNVLRLLDDAQRKRGVVMTSSGNFAQAFAFAGRKLGVPVVVVMLEQTSAYKVEMTRGHGAEVVFCGNDAGQRQPTVERIAAERGMLALDTWEEQPIPAGHGTIGLEILEQCPQVEQVLVPTSSGGLIAGIAAAIKLTRPEVSVIGVQPVRANAAWRSLEAGQPVEIDDWDSIADGLSARRPGAYPFAHLQAFVDRIVLVEERDIGRAFETLLYRAKLLSEPAGAVATAAFLAGKVDQARNTVALLSGGNLTTQAMDALFALARQ
ncbi:MAG: threonine/serine dehydratase [Gammaproteobacteria bacterium]|nr:threonine/serine dehydratase [Gammaproteobacteria bacterium]